jgi:hypothetical protein
VLASLAPPATVRCRFAAHGEGAMARWIVNGHLVSLWPLTMGKATS